MRRTWTAVLLVLIASLALAQEAKIKAFDTLTIITSNQPQYSGDFVVASDGSVNVPVAGRFEVAGKTVSQVQREVQARVRKFVRNAVVSVVLKLQAVQFVYLVSEKVLDGAVPWNPDMTVRQLVAKHPDLLPLDSYSARLYRPGKPTLELDLVKLMRGSTSDIDVQLNPGDVLTLLPSADKPVWVLGLVSDPGLVRVRADDGIEQAIALAGGQIGTSLSASELMVTLRRGGETRSWSAAEIYSGPRTPLEPGDTIIVEGPRQISVTIGGTVVRSGEVKVREGSGLLAAIQAGGGPRPNGSLARIVLFRKDQTTVYDGRQLARGGVDSGPTLHDGDFVYVPENLREYHVLGFVAKPGPQLIPDSKDIRLADALAAAEGLRTNGTYRRVVLLRPAEDGKTTATRYDLDKYIKDADVTQNPVIQPGDIVFFDQTSGSALTDILRVIPSLILLDRFF